MESEKEKLLIDIQTFKEFGEAYNDQILKIID